LVQRIAWVQDFRSDQLTTIQRSGPTVFRKGLSWYLHYNWIQQVNFLRTRFWSWDWSYSV